MRTARIGAAILLLAAAAAPQDPPAAPPFEDAAEDALESLEVWLGGVGESLRGFAFDSVAAAYASSFRGEPLFLPPPEGAATREVGLGVVEVSADDEGRKGVALDRLKDNLETIARIDDIVFKLRSAEWDTPRLSGLLEVRLLGREAGGASLYWKDRYRASFRHEGGRWSIVSCDRVALIRQRAERLAYLDVDAGLRLPVRETDDLPAFDEPYASLGGVAAGDYDGDGDDDLFYPTIGGGHLFRNDEGRFAESTREAGLSLQGPSASALFVDTDNDGDLDLLAVTHATSRLRVKGQLAESPWNALRLFENEGGRFRDITQKSGLVTKGPATSAAAADVDGDGDLDLYVAMYADIVNEAQIIMGLMPRSVLDARDGRPNQLWINNGDGTFAERAEDAGVSDAGRSYACGFGDLDGDRWPDLYVANDFGRNGLYRNRGDGTFENVTVAYGAGDAGFGMGVAWCDADGDGRDDLYVSNMYSTAGNRILNRGKDGLADEKHQALLRNASGNTLFRNAGGKLENVSAASGAASAGWAWSCQFSDVDFDGRPDLYVAAGYITGTTRADL